MKKQEFVEHVAASIQSLNEANEKLTAQLAQVDKSSDEYKSLYDARKTNETRIRYLTMIHNDECASIVSAIKVSKSTIDAIASDAYMLEKLAALFFALKAQTKISTARKNVAVLANVVAHLIATDFADVNNEEIRRVLTHKTTRQADMTLNLFERLNACELTSETRSAEQDSVKAYRLRRFDRDNEIVKRLSAIYA